MESSPFSMKASLKFRDEGKPLVRAKVPISILGLPFLSGLAAALDDARHLRLDLSTDFASGPSLRLSYRPNDSDARFALVLKTGLGPLGAPDTGSPFSMATEFGLLARPGVAGPSFSIRFRPRFGDFAIKKTISSTAAAKVATLGDANGQVLANGDDTQIKGISQDNRFPADGIGGGISRLLTGFELNASSVLPVRSHTAVRFKWGLRVPPELRSAIEDQSEGIPFSKLPLLVMSKISIERGADDGRSSRTTRTSEKKKAGIADGDLVQEHSLLRRQLEALQSENGALRKAVEELRAEVGGWKVAAGEADGKGRSRATAPAGKTGCRGNEKGAEKHTKVATDDPREELRKALAASTGGGI